MPDATTVWLFRKALTDGGLIEEMFSTFNRFLDENGYEAKGGQIIDATIIPVPVQHNSRAENQQVKKGAVPPTWKEAPHKLSQKDTDARWTKKNNESYFGYKNHVNIDAEYGFIHNHRVTDASVHDSRQFCEVLDGANEGDKIWAASAYRSPALEEVLAEVGYESEINERGYRNHPLTEAQKESNRGKSKIRSKVEHIFGTYVTNMGETGSVYWDRAGSREFGVEGFNL
ncbi:MAG: IS5 family transposase [Thermosynechococcaceae cyanobacterium]